MHSNQMAQRWVFINTLLVGITGATMGSLLGHPALTALAAVISALAYAIPSWRQRKHMLTSARELSKMYPAESFTEAEAVEVMATINQINEERYTWSESASNLVPIFFYLMPLLAILDMAEQPWVKNLGAWPVIVFPIIAILLGLVLARVWEKREKKSLVTALVMDRQARAKQ